MIIFGLLCNHETVHEKTTQGEFEAASIYRITTDQC